MCNVKERTVDIAPHLTPEQRAFMALETPITDEELAKIYDRALRKDVGLPEFYPRTSQANMAGIRAVRVALADARRDAETALAMEGAER